MGNFPNFIRKIEKNQIIFTENDLKKRKLVFAVGNPGKWFQNTKHNIGMKFIDYVSE